MSDGRGAVAQKVSRANEISTVRMGGSFVDRNSCRMSCIEFEWGTGVRRRGPHGCIGCGTRSQGRGPKFSRSHLPQQQFCETDRRVFPCCKDGNAVHLTN